NDFIETACAYPPEDLLVHHHRWGKSAVSQAVDRFERTGAILCRLMKVNTEGFLCQSRELGASCRLARFGLANPDDVPARRFGSKVMVKRNDAMNFRPCEVHFVRDDRDGFFRHVPQLFLNAVENR